MEFIKCVNKYGRTVYINAMQVDRVVPKIFDGTPQVFFDNKGESYICSAVDPWKKDTIENSILHR